jgi:hypothetical protein
VHPRLLAVLHPDARIGEDVAVAQFRARYPQASPEALFHRIVTPARSWRGQVEEAQALLGALVRFDGAKPWEGYKLPVYEGPAKGRVAEALNRGEEVWLTINNSVEQT